MVWQVGYLQVGENETYSKGIALHMQNSQSICLSLSLLRFTDTLTFCVKVLIDSPRPLGIHLLNYSIDL